MKMFTFVWVFQDNKGKFHGFDISYNRDPSKKGDTPMELKEYNKEVGI